MIKDDVGPIQLYRRSDEPRLGYNPEEIKKDWNSVLKEVESLPYSEEDWGVRKIPKLDVADLCESFHGRIESEINIIDKHLGSSELGEAERESCLKTAKIMLKQIEDRVFKASNINESRFTVAEYREIVYGANRDFLQAKLSLRETYRFNELKPVVFQHNGKWAVSKPMPSIEKLILSGGGGKGMLNGVVLAEFEKAGLLKEVDSIVGTSAGALTAISLACGTSGKEFSRYVDMHDMFDLLKTKSNFSTVYPMVEFATKLGGYMPATHGARAGNALEELDKISANKVHEVLSNADNWKIVRKKYKYTDPIIYDRLKILRNTPDFNRSRAGRMVTFGDLAALAQLREKGKPGHENAFSVFKDLSITGTNSNDKKIAYFSSKHNPEMPIAVAGRISMSIPHVFVPIVFDEEKGDGNKVWTDGGVNSNTPVGSVIDSLGRDRLDAIDGMVVMAFGNDGQTQQDMIEEYKPKAAPDFPSLVDRSSYINNPSYHAANYLSYVAGHAAIVVDKTANFAVSAFAGDSKYSEKADLDRLRLFEISSSVAVVHTGSVGTKNIGVKPQGDQESNSWTGWAKGVLTNGVWAEGILDQRVSYRQFQQDKLVAQMHALEFIESRQNQVSVRYYDSQEDAEFSILESQDVLSTYDDTNRSDTVVDITAKSSRGLRHRRGGEASRSYSHKDEDEEI